MERHPPADDDPTGIRALLSSLPDPGPMPQELVARIQDTLAEEARAHAPGIPADAEHTLGSRLRPILPWAAAASLLLVGAGAALNFGSHSTATSLAAADMSSAAVDARKATGLEAAGVPAEIAISVSGATWTDDSLLSAARQLADSDPPPPLAEDSAPAPPPAATGNSFQLTSVVAARECATALGVAAATPVVIDLGTYAATPAALVIAGPVEGERTAYVVGRDCHLDHPSLLSGPHQL